MATNQWIGRTSQHKTLNFTCASCPLRLRTALSLVITWMCWSLVPVLIVLLANVWPYSDNGGKSWK